MLDAIPTKTIALDAVCRLTAAMVASSICRPLFQPAHESCSPRGLCVNASTLRVAWAQRVSSESAPGLAVCRKICEILYSCITVSAIVSYEAWLGNFLPSSFCFSTDSRICNAAKRRSTRPYSRIVHLLRRRTHGRGLKSTLEITPFTSPENHVVLPCQSLWDFLIQSIPTFATGKLVSQKLYGKRNFGDVIWPAALARSRSGAGQYDHGSNRHSKVYGGRSHHSLERFG
mmetsp:Transcript_9947/g.23758  ORF Transcript_9947/g.23758 Transcript_9947/m.23758 type:complete len:230 (+) Transcript_9947:463-1152(+)